MNHFEKPPEDRGPSSPPHHTTVCWTHYCRLFPSKSKHLLEPPLQGCLWISPLASAVVSQLTEMKTTAIIQLPKPSGLPGSFLIRDADRWNWHGQLGRNFTLTNSIQHTGSSGTGVSWRGGWWGGERGRFWADARCVLFDSHSPVALSQKVLLHPEILKHGMFQTPYTQTDVL